MLFRSCSLRQSQILLGSPVINCVIYDRDILSFDDPMGIVQIPLTLDHFHCRNSMGDTTAGTISFGRQWYTVCTNQVSNNAASSVKDKEICKNATGELYINVHVESQWMVHINDFVHHPGNSQGYRLPNNGRYDIEIAWNTVTTTIQSQQGDEVLIDTACIAINERNGKISMENCIFYHNLNNPNNSIESTSIASTTTIASKENYTSGDAASGKTTRVLRLLNCIPLQHCH